VDCRFIGRLTRRGTFESYDDLPRRTAISNTAGPEVSDQDESQPERRDIEKPESRKKAVAGVEIGMMPEGQGSTFEPEEDREPQG
jgi:hypothetical protein